MEEQIAASAAQNKIIMAGIAALNSIVPRIESLEFRLQQQGDKPPHSSASADTHVMVEEGESVPRHGPFPPNYKRGDHGDSPLMSRSLHPDSDQSFSISKDPNIKMVPPQVECKDSLKIKPKEFLDYFENIDAFIVSWENQPGNKNTKLKFKDSETFALRNLKVPQ